MCSEPDLAVLHTDTRLVPGCWPYLLMAVGAAVASAGARLTATAADASARPAFLNQALPDATLGAIDDAELARKAGAGP